MESWINLVHPGLHTSDPVWFALPSDDDQQQWEALAAESQADGSFLVRAVPLFAYDLN
ncbi:hypothetical protein NOK12_19940 [Nocardioides sp. OK12]|nr:hypothetical protein NOK12_19940 [Nocardioides sp. OK12]